MSDFEKAVLLVLGTALIGSGLITLGLVGPNAPPVLAGIGSGLLIGIGLATVAVAVGTRREPQR